MAADDLSFTGLAVVLMVAAVALLVARRLRQPMVLGYLAAGLLVGPHGLSPFRLVTPAGVETLASLGIVFIMVSLGLEYNPRKLRSMGVAPVGTAIVQMLLGFAGGRIAAELLGFNDRTALFIGVALAISSTIVAVKVLDERNELGTSWGRLAVGVLLVQDLVAIGFLGIVEGLSVTGEFALGRATPVVFGLVVFALAALVVGALVVPRVLHEAATGSKELLLITLLGLVFGVSILAEHFGFSLALGAFLTGAIVAETRVVHEAERMVEPLKHMFTAVFFVAVGMLIDLSEMLAAWRTIAVLSAVVIVTRIAGTGIPAFLFGQPSRAALRAGASISQIGEFSFIIITAGVSHALIGSEVLAIFVGVTAVTTLLTPYLVALSDPLHRMLFRITPSPLRTYADLYTGWVGRLGDTEETVRHRSKESQLVRRIALNVIALFAIGALSFLADNILRGTVLEVGGRTFPAAWAIWPLVGIVAIPFLVTVYSATRALVVEVVLELVPDRVTQSAEPPIALKVVRASLTLVLALAFGAIGIALLPATGQGGTVLVLVAAGIVLLAGALLWRRIQGLHAHVEGAIENLFGVSRTAQERDEVLRLIGRHYTVSLGTEAINLPDGSPLAHHTIRDTQIRNRTGATIVSVERGTERFVNPAPSIVLLPGDRILLMGEPHHLEKARKMALTTVAPAHAAQEPRRRREAPDPVEVRQVVLSAESVAVGRSIAELSLRTRTGASLVAAIRDSDHIQNPPPNFILLGRDRLFLLGTHRQLDAAQEFLERKVPTSPAAPPGAPAKAPTSDGPDKPNEPTPS